MISLEWYLKSETCQGISEQEFHWGFVCLCMLCCFQPGMLHFYSVQSTCGLFQMDSNATSNPGNRLRITWVKMTIRLRIGISHPSNSGKVVCGKCYISHCFYFFWYLFWLFCLFFVFALMSLGTSLSNQKPILTFLLSFWLIIKLYHDYYDSITIYYITKLYYSRLFYVVVSLFI